MCVSLGTYCTYGKENQEQAIKEQTGEADKIVACNTFAGKKCISCPPLSSEPKVFLSCDSHC